MDRLIDKIFTRKKSNHEILFLHITILCLCMPICIVCHRDTTSEDHANELPFCRPTSRSHQSKSLLVLSTLDGHVTGLDTLTGSVVWSFSTEPGAMLASTISNHEYDNQGKWSRLVPALNGDLFMFDGENMESVPVTADSLLSNSMKVSEDTVIAGGIEINFYGIKRDTGKLVYRCGIETCNHSGDVIPNSSNDILIIRRQTRTVRAVSANSGTEKWNYSVGQHEVKLPVSTKEEGCHQEKETYIREDEHATVTLNNIIVRFKSSEGEILVFNDNVPMELLWKHKFTSPIVHAWNVTDKHIQMFDLLRCQFNSLVTNNEETDLPNQPLLYVGLYKEQFYIMQSHYGMDSLPFKFNILGDDLKSAPPKVSWKPYLITSHSRTPVILGQLPSNEESAISDVNNNDENTALVISPNGVEYPFENGLYLSRVKSTARVNYNVAFVEEGEQDSIDQIIIVSLWYWWKEVLMISVTLAVALNLFYVKVLRIRRKCLEQINHEVIEEKSTNKSSPNIQRETSTQSSSASLSQLGTPPVEFVSRYLTDFEPLEILGKGGFGVVFCARNKIDDCEYAIKRIPLPDNQESKERILREVKTLAKLDHPGIVRYYNSWLECPPADWQAQMDQYMNTDVFTPTTSITVDDLNKMYKSSTKDRGDGFGDISINSNEETSNMFNVECSTSYSDVRHLKKDKDCIENDSSEWFGSKPLTDSGLVIKRNDMEASSDSFIVFENSDSKLTSEKEKCQINDTTNRKEKTLDKLILDAGADRDNDILQSESESYIPSFTGNNGANSQLNKFSPWVKPTKMLLYIQMQLCRKNSLKEWLNENNETRDKMEVLDIFYQIVLAVEYVHDQGLMHRDLKSSNIFFALDGSVKVGDFGLVTYLSPNEKVEVEESCGPEKSNSKHTHQVGTTLYMSPEQLAGAMYDHKVDIFSLGLVFFELLVPFTTGMERIKTMNDARALKFSSSFIKDSPEEYNLVKQMLEHEPNKRPNASIILNDPLFEDFQVMSDRIRRGTSRIRTTSRSFSMSGSSGSGQGFSEIDSLL